MERTAAGFTLIEMIVVVTVLAILAAISMPAFSGSRDDARIRSAARRLVSVLRLAASEAVTSGTEFRLCMDLDRNVYWLEYRPVEEGGAMGFEPYTKMTFDSESQSSASQPNRVQLASVFTVTLEESSLPPGWDSDAPPPAVEKTRFEHGNCIRFRADGTADGREIGIEDPSGFKMIVRVDAITSRVVIEAIGRGERQ